MAGEIDALMSPEPRKSMLARPDGYRRLFRDSRAEELRYYDQRPTRTLLQPEALFHKSLLDT